MDWRGVSGITVGTVVGVTLGSDVPFDIGRMFIGVLGVGTGVTLGSDAPFGICGISFGNAGGVIRCKIVAISTNAFVVSSPYVSDGIGDFGI